MMTKVDASKPVQANLFKVMLRDLVFERHELVLQEKAIDWKRFEKVLEPAYCENNGRPSIPVRINGSAGTVPARGDGFMRLFWLQAKSER